MRCVVLYLFSVLLSGLLVGAYYIDDTSPSVNFTGAWGNYTVAQAKIDQTRCHNATFTALSSSCWKTKDCRFDIPFTGKQITVYVVLNGTLGTNSSFSVDGAHPTTQVKGPFTVDRSALALAYLYALYENKNLTDGNHTLTVALRPYNSSTSGFLAFDYADIVGTDPQTSSNKKSSNTTLWVVLGIILVVLVLAGAGGKKTYDVYWVAVKR
jgi:hypothetical protein